MPANVDVLERLFAQVAGRAPRGAPVSDAAVRKKMKEMRAEVVERYGDAADVFRVPGVYLDFWKRFGGEKSLTDRMTTLRAPDALEGAATHLIFGLHHGAEDYFGWDYFVLEDDDPGTMHARAAEVDAGFDPDEEDGTEPWEDFTDTLTYALLAIASENLLRSLKRRVVLPGCDTEPFPTLLSRMECLYGTDTSEVTVPSITYFGRGVLVSHWDQRNDAEIGFASDELEEAFLAKFPRAKRLSSK